MTLTGKQKESLSEAICAAYTEKSLEAMVSYRLDRRLEHIAGPGALPTRVAELIDASEREGWTHELIVAAHLYVSSNPELLAFCRQYAPDALTQTAPAETVGSAEAGLDALRSLMSSPEVLRAAGAFRDNFRAASDGIAKLGAYKTLHDALHEVQLLRLDRLEQIERDISKAGSLKQDDANSEEIETQILYLEALGPRLRDAAAKLPTRPAEEAWISRLAQAIGALREANAGGATASLGKGLKRLRAVLAVEPSRINGLLTAAARELRLPSLADALRSIRAAAEQHGVSGPDMDRLRLGASAVESLRDALGDLVEQHDRWQQIDSDLRLLSKDTEPPMEDMELVWPGMKSFVGAVAGSSGEGWARALAQATAELDAAQAAGDMTRVLKLFPRFRQRAILRFFEVDHCLKELCDQIGRIGGPLDSIEATLS